MYFKGEVYVRDLIVGTRKSKLALTQTNYVVKLLKQAGIKNNIKIKEISTEGDRRTNVSLSSFGSRGAFIDDIEETLLSEKVDFAVHSMKDLPINMNDQLVIAAMPIRENAADAYVANNHIHLNDLPSGSLIGTSSLRRKAQILSVRPDLKTHWIRGTVESRLQQMREGKFDAIILAVAGLKRLGLNKELITEELPVHQFVPAAGQGVLAVQCRKNDVELRNMLKMINDRDVYNTVLAERTLIQLLDESDQAPIGAYASIKENQITLHTSVCSLDGKEFIQETVIGEDAVDVANIAAKKLLKQGANNIIERAIEELNK